MAKILLNPVDFDALHLSVLAYGGIGHTSRMRDDAPHCVVGHAATLQGVGDSLDDDQYECEFAQRLDRAGLSWEVNDVALESAGVKHGEKVDWETYVKLLDIDVKEG